MNRLGKWRLWLPVCRAVAGLVPSVACLQPEYISNRPWLSNFFFLPPQHLGPIPLSFSLAGVEDGHTVDDKRQHHSSVGPTSTGIATRHVQFVHDRGSYLNSTQQVHLSPLQIPLVFIRGLIIYCRSQASPVAYLLATSLLGVLHSLVSALPDARFAFPIPVSQPRPNSPLFYRYILSNIIIISSFISHSRIICPVHFASDVIPLR